MAARSAPTTSACHSLAGTTGEIAGDGLLVYSCLLFTHTLMMMMMEDDDDDDDYEDDDDDDYEDDDDDDDDGDDSDNKV